MMLHNAVQCHTMFDNEEFVLLTHCTVLLCTMPINSILCNTTTYDDLLYYKESYTAMESIHGNKNVHL